jgi:uncharacterized RmlC-like cupin family protein
MYSLSMVNVPNELSGYFTASDFEQYPKVAIPQSFSDERGNIINIADGSLGDVAIIQSNAHSTRANHIHDSDWHLSYCLLGSLNYSYEETTGKVYTVFIQAGDLFFTPVGVPHRMDFLQETLLVVVSRNSRRKDNYEHDTKKYFVNSEATNKKNATDLS